MGASIIFENVVNIILRNVCSLILIFKEGFKMNTRKVFILMVLLVFGFSSFSCFAQSSSNDQRIVGTWVHTRDNGNTITLVFNANGSGSFTYSENSNWNRTITYGISLTGGIQYVDQDGNRNDFLPYFSPDGRTLIWGSQAYRKR